MKKNIDIYGKAFIIIFCLGIVLSIGTLSQLDVSDSRTETVYPSVIQKVNSHTIKYVFDLNSSDKNDICLHFVTDLKTVQVYNEDELIYDIKNDNNFLGKTPGKIFHFIDIPSGYERITVLISGKYAKENGIHPHFRMGNSRGLFFDNIVRSLPYAIVYFLIFVCGLVLFLFWIVVRNEIKNDKMVFYFSIFLMITGMWLIRGSDFIGLLDQNHFVLYFIGYILFLQIPVLFFSFSIYYWGINCKKWVKNLYYGCSFINMLGCIIIHISGVLEFKDSAFCTHLLLIFSFLFSLYGMIFYWKRFGFSRKIKLTLIPFMLILLSAIIDYTGFYSNTLSSYKRGGGILLLFIFCITIDVLNDLAIQLREGQRNAIYKELATTDFLTGLYNRTAFANWEAEHQTNFNDICIVLCDLNNLKYYNDNYGHQLGDKYIMDASHMIKTAFIDKGKSYRIGGDEFVVILQHISLSDLLERIQFLKGLQCEYNEKSDVLQIQIALGYAFAETSDRQLSDIVNRADKSMYKEKISMKNNFYS